MYTELTLPPPRPTPPPPPASATMLPATASGPQPRGGARHHPDLRRPLRPAGLAGQELLRPRQRHRHLSRGQRRPPAPGHHQLLAPVQDPRVGPAPVPADHRLRRQRHRLPRPRHPRGRDRRGRARRRRPRRCRARPPRARTPGRERCGGAGSPAPAGSSGPSGRHRRSGAARWWPGGAAPRWSAAGWWCDQCRGARRAHHGGREPGSEAPSGLRGGTRVGDALYAGVDRPCTGGRGGGDGWGGGLRERSGIVVPGRQK